MNMGLVIDNGKRMCTISKNNVYQWRSVKTFSMEELNEKKQELKNKRKCQTCDGKGHIKTGQQTLK